MKLKVWYYYKLSIVTKKKKKKKRKKSLNCLENSKFNFNYYFNSWLNYKGIETLYDTQLSVSSIFGIAFEYNKFGT